MKRKNWEITIRKAGLGYGTFRFEAANKILAHDHAMTLKHDIDFEWLHGRVMVSDNINERVRAIAVRFVGWKEE